MTPHRVARYTLHSLQSPNSLSFETGAHNLMLLKLGVFIYRESNQNLWRTDGFLGVSNIHVSMFGQRT